MYSSIDQEFEMEDIIDAINEDVDSWIQDLIESYSTAAKKFVDKIRKRTKADGEKATWNNITWNLRSSIGFLILHDGNIIEEYFPTVGGGAEGSKTGNDYAKEIAALVNEGDGVQLVIVAGMEYAVFVEDRDIDVLTHSSKGFPKQLIEEFAR